MANVPFKLKIAQVATGAIDSEQINLKFPSGKNAYRIDSIRVQIDDWDVVADNDEFTIQFTYDDLQDGTFHTIDDLNEILTLHQMWSLDVADGTGADTGQFNDDLIEDVLRGQGILYLDGRDFKDVFITKEKFFINVKTVGQDAAEDIHFEMKGKFVRIPNDDIERIQEGNTLQ